MSIPNNPSPYKGPKLDISYWNYPDIFELCSSFFDSLENYDLDFSNINIPDRLYLFSEQNPVTKQTDITNPELINMLIYISIIQTHYHQISRDEPYLETPISFTEYGKIFFGIKNYLRDLLSQLHYVDNFICRLYPLKQYNIFYKPKVIYDAYQKGKIDSEKTYAEIIYTKRVLTRVIKHYRITFLEELLTDNTYKNFNYSIPTACILPLAFLLCSYRQHKKLPLHVQYMIISDAIINISSAKKHSLKKILENLLKIRKHFVEIVENTMNTDKGLSYPNYLSADDNKFLQEMSASDYYKSQKNLFDSKFNYGMNHQYFNAFRKEEKKFLSNPQNFPDSPVSDFYNSPFYSANALQPLMANQIYDPSPKSFAYEHYLKNSLIQENTHPKENPFCPHYFSYFFD